MAEKKGDTDRQTHRQTNKQTDKGKQKDYSPRTESGTIITSIPELHIHTEVTYDKLLLLNVLKDKNHANWCLFKQYWNLVNSKIRNSKN